MNHFQNLAIVVSLVLAVAACGDSGGDANTQATAEAALSDEARFDSDMSKRGCELLTPGLVADTFDVPADALRQMKIMGCRYSWGDDATTLEAAISMIRAYDSEAGAASWFSTATRNRTAEEMQSEMDKIAGRVDESEQLDTDLKKSTANDLLNMVDGKAVTFEDVAGVGDEARVSDEGTVYVRVDNLTFMVTAYKGPTAPPPDFQGADMQQMVEIGKKHAAQWAIETAPQRKADGIRLAGAIVDAL